LRLHSNGATGKFAAIIQSGQPLSPTHVVLLKRFR
jgi:hypothetical protein